MPTLVGEGTTPSGPSSCPAGGSLAWEDYPRCTRLGCREKATRYGVSPSCAAVHVVLCGGHPEYASSELYEPGDDHWQVTATIQRFHAHVRPGEPPS